MRLRTALLIAVTLGLAGCSESSSDGAGSPAPSASVTFDAELHEELVGMLERDQSERSGGPMGEGDEARTARLKEIVAEHGWPTIALVGEDGEDAAWAIAQHSDFDLAFQKEALGLIRDAVEDDQASPGNLAYLEDRVAVAEGRPQTYGTQIQCGPKGPRPSTPIADEGGVEQRRAEAGLDPLADYLDQMAAICAGAG